MTKEVFGANKSEKWDIAYLLACVFIGAVILTVSLMDVFIYPILWLLAIPGAALVACGVGAIYARIEMIALRIRLEESAAKSALIDEITAIYRGEKR